MRNFSCKRSLMASSRSSDALINSAVNAALSSHRFGFSPPVRPDASINSAVNATLSSHRFGCLPRSPDASINSAVNAALSSHRFGFSSPVRPELVEGLIERSYNFLSLVRQFFYHIPIITN